MGIVQLYAEGVTSAGSQLNTALTESVNPNSIVTQFVEILPWVGLAVVVGFVVYEARKMVKGLAKAKVKL